MLSGTPHTLFSATSALPQPPPPPIRSDSCRKHTNQPAMLVRFRKSKFDKNPSETGRVGTP